MFKFKDLSKKTLKSKSGFTLIEFSIALAILSILLIIILQISNNTIAIYQKGLSTKAVSTAGRDLLDEFSKTIAQSPTSSLSVICDKITNSTNQENCKNNTNNFQTQLVYNKSYNGDKPAYGVFCTGKYSYFWNSGYAIKGGYARSLNVGPNNPRLLRIDDPDHELCVNYINSSGSNLSTSYPQKEVVDLLENNQDLQVALYDFTIFPPSQDRTISRIFYSGTFVLGTLTGDININANNDYCKSNNILSLASDSSYCAINKFNFAAQALGEQND